MNNNYQHHLRLLNTPYKMWFYFLTRLPSILWFGIRVVKVTPEAGQVSINLHWRSKNPFKSIYFAAQCAAAELSSGLLATLALQSQQPVSMLVTRFEIEFVKKATRKTVFTCQEGLKIQEAIEASVASGQGQQITVRSEGVQEGGEVVSIAHITWSFRPKRS